MLSSPIRESTAVYTVPTGVKAISFDIWKTLLNGNKAFTRPRLRLIFDMLGYTGLDVEQLRNAYRAADKFYNSESERLGRDFGMADRLSMMFEVLGIDAPVPDASAIEAIQAEVVKLRLQPEYMPTFTEPDLPQTLQELRKQGYSLGLLSNTGIDNRQVMEPVLRALGIWDLFDVAMFTSDDGRAKPNPELFRHTAKELNAEPTQVLHVGDNANADCRAAEAGLHAVLYSQKGEPEGNSYPFITSMKELLG
jgi:HAD superfamily hydrolase (TIGR01662 family)